MEKKHLKHASWLFIDKILRLGVNLIFSIWLARYFGPEGMGLLAYAQSIAAIFCVISCLGLDTVVVKKIINDELEVGRLLFTAIIMRAVIASLILTVSLTLAFYINSREAWLATIFLINSILLSFSCMEFYLQAKLNGRLIFISSLISVVISSTIKIYLISNEYSVLYIAFAFVIEALVLFLIYIVIFYKLIYKKVIVNFSSEIAKVLIKDCWPMVVSGLFVIIYMKIDQVMIKEMLNAEALGIYSVAVKLSEAWYFIPTVIATGLFPWVLEAKAASKEIYMNIIKKLFILMNVVSFGAGVFAYLFSYQIIELLFGREYLESAAVLTLHIWGGVFISLGIIRSKWIVIENLQYLIVYFISIGMIVNVILNFILIPQYGIYGAAVATLVSQFIGTMVAPLFFRKIRGVSIMMFKSLYLTFNRNELVDIVKLLKRKF